MKGLQAILSLLVIVALMVAGAFAYDRLVTEPLRQQLKNPLIEKAILDRLLKLEQQGKAPTPERPLVLNIAPQGAAPVPVQVFLQPPQAPPPARPGEKPEAPTQPKVVAISPGVYCATKEDCDRIYRQAPQAITVDAQVRVGTIVTVCLNPQAGIDGKFACVEGSQRANLPLAEPVKFQAQFVLAEKGIFQGLNVAGAPIEITNVRTETQVETKLQAPPLPYHFGIFARGSTSGTFMLGLRYVNRAWAGFYEVEPTFRYEPALPSGQRIAREVWLTYVQPFGFPSFGPKLPVPPKPAGAAPGATPARPLAGDER